MPSPVIDSGMTLKSVCIKHIVCEKPSSDEATPGEDISSTPSGPSLLAPEGISGLIDKGKDGRGRGESTRLRGARHSHKHGEEGRRNS